jgi:hypothetical protein
MSDTEKWYYSRQGQRLGPMPLENLKQALAQGQMLATDLVWKAGLPNWVPAHTIAALMPAGGSPPLGYYTAPPVAADDIGQNAGIRMLLPVGRSGWAIAAGYLGLFSLLIFPAPIALGISIIAILDIRRHPDRHGMGRAIFGLIMGSLGTLAVAVLVVNLILHR